MAETAKDLYMQFADIRAQYGAADSSTLQSGEKDTGLSIRGGLVWLLHLFQYWLPVTYSGGASSGQVAALSTVRGLAAMPEIGDQGVIDKVRERTLVNSAVGFQVWATPITSRYLPPIPLAAPTIFLYIQGLANDAGLQGTYVYCRIGFTTAPLDNAMYTEIAEVWGW